MAGAIQDLEQIAFLERIAAEPALVQLVGLVFVGAVVWWWISRAAGRVREARERAGTRDFLLGVEQALVGDVDAAHRRLERVVRDDPTNAAARLLRAELLTQLGRPSEAHREHVALRRAFGSRAPRNEIGLARALLDAARPAEAIEVVDGAAHADLVETSRIRFAAQRARDRDADAARAGATLAAHLPPGAERDEVRDATAACAERAARRVLSAGRSADAFELLDVARRAAGNVHPTIRRLAARLRASGPRDQALAAPESGALVPSRIDVSTAAADVFSDPSLRFATLESAGRALDAIEANAQHIARLCRTAEAGDPQASAELVELGLTAVDAMLARAIERGPEDRVYASVLHRMGPTAAAWLLDAWTRRRAAGPDGSKGRDRATATLSTLLRALGPDAREKLEEHLSTEDRELRKALVDYYLALGDVESFTTVLEVLPPVEVVQRMNDADDALLIPFLRALPDGHFLLEILLPDGGFTRDVAVLEAIPDALAPAALERLIVRRGYAHSLASALIERLADPRTGAIAARILDSFAARVVPALVMAFADVDRPAAERDAVADRLVAARSQAVAPLCRCFGASAAPLDADVTAVLKRIGDVAVPELREGYRQGGILERIVGPLARRRTHRREMVIRSLASIGTLTAQTALVQLRERESDTDLTLRIAQALHRIDAEGPRVSSSSDDDQRSASDG